MIFIVRGMVAENRDLPKIDDRLRTGDVYLVLNEHHMYTPALDDGKLVWFDLGKFPPEGPKRILKDEEKK